MLKEEMLRMRRSSRPTFDEILRKVSQETTVGMISNVKTPKVFTPPFF